MSKPISTWILTRAPVLIAVVLCVLAITPAGGDSSKIGLAKIHRISEHAFKSHANANGLEFTFGEHKLFRETSTDPTRLVTQRELSRIAVELKRQIKLPFDIQVHFEDCGGPDSFYDDDTHKITICYELIDAYYHLFSRTLKESTARDEATKGAIAAMFLHEVAHALIDGWDLPIAGREEDAADQFSTLLLINGIPHGVQLALDGARSFELLAKLERDLEKDYSDSHSLDEQRFFNTICLVYGHRPEQYEYLIRDETLPTYRAFECEENYQRVSKSWQSLLAPYLVRPNARSFNGLPEVRRPALWQVGRFGSVSNR